MLHLVEMDTDPIDLHVNISLNKENPCLYFFQLPPRMIVTFCSYTSKD